MPHSAWLVKAGGTSARGYGIEHQNMRAKWAVLVDRGEVACWRCKRPIVPGTPWDLGHDDVDRSIYRGPEHQACNRATRRHRKLRRQAARQARAQSRSW